MALVVGFHLSGAVGNGYLGVDVFFVLSGYLITGLLLAERAATGRIDLRQFFGRRVRRLFPALLVVCAVVAALGVLPGRHTAAIEWGVLTTLAYVANIWQYSGHDTFLLQHTWTLALEEQFYLAWPVLLAACGGVGRRLAVLVLPALGAVLAVDLVAGQPAVLHSYVRAGGLVLGSGLAIATAAGSRWVDRLRPAAGPCLLLLIVLAALPRPLGALLTGWPVSAAAVLTVPVVVGLVQPGRLGRWLSAPALVWIGRRSYGIYLWHFPILAVALAQVTHAVPVPIRAGAAVVVTVGCAAASFRWIEQPWLRRRRSAVSRDPGRSGVGRGSGPA